MLSKLIPQNEGGFQACHRGLLACLGATTMSEELLRFLSENTSSEDTVMIPASLKHWFITVEIPAASSRKGKWMDTKLPAFSG